MAILLNPVDVAAFANAWQLQATGKNGTLTAADTTQLNSVGEAILQTGLENTISSLYILMGKIWTNTRKYRGKAKLVQAINTGVYTHRLGIISVYSRRAIPSGYWNTDVFPENFKPGATNGQELDPVTGNPVSSKSMWEQSPAVTQTFFWGGQKVMDFEAPTQYLDKLEAAFRSESEFMDYINGIAQEFDNDMTQYQENWNRQELVSAIAQDIDMEADRPESVVHCVTEFNTEFGINPGYTAQELTTTYAKDFYSWLASKIKIVKSRMAERSVLFHWNPVKTVNGVDYDLLRFSEPSNLKFAILSPVMQKLETYVLPEVFHDDLLRIDDGKFEEFAYWQNISVPGSIKIKPAVNDTDPTSATYMQQIDGALVEADPLLYIFDERRVLTDIQFKRALSSPVEARRGMVNTFHHWSFNTIQDATMNSCVFLMD